MTPAQIAHKTGYDDARNHRTTFGHRRDYEFPEYKADYNQGFDEGLKHRQEDLLALEQQRQRID